MTLLYEGEGEHLWLAPGDIVSFDDDRVYVATSYEYVAVRELHALAEVRREEKMRTSSQ